MHLVLERVPGVRWCVCRPKRKDADEPFSPNGEGAWLANRAVRRSSSEPPRPKKTRFSVTAVSLHGRRWALKAKREEKSWGTLSLPHYGRIFKRPCRVLPRPPAESFSDIFPLILRRVLTDKTRVAFWKVVSVLADTVVWVRESGWADGLLY